MKQYFADGKIPAQRVYNKTGNSFAVGQQTVLVPDPNVNSTTNITNATTIRVSLPKPNLDISLDSTTLKKVYPRELVDMLHAHLNTVQKRATNTSSGIPAGCTPTGPGSYVGAAGRTTVATSAMIIAVVAALIL